MCQYFWWGCETCAVPREYVLYCQIGLIHSPCNNYTQPALLPFVTPPPVCQCCGEARVTQRCTNTLPIRSQNTRQAVILPELRKILNDKLFWVIHVFGYPTTMESPRNKMLIGRRYLKMQNERERSWVPRATTIRNGLVKRTKVWKLHGSICVRQWYVQL